MTAAVSEQGAPADKGLKGGALGLWSTVVVGVASTAPAYSLAATLGFIVIFVGVQAPAVAILAFVPMWMISIGYSELNKEDPDCGTSFTWATRVFGPRVGWFAGGWGIIASDVLIMASLAQIAGQYVFLLFGADGIGENPASGWVLLVGLIWLALMTYICYRGIEVSAALQRVLLAVELVMLAALAITALVKVYSGNHPATSIRVAGSWFNPFHISSFTAFVSGIILMLFIYWGWDTAVSVNEETKDPEKTPGRAAILSTVILLVTYVLVIIGAQAFAGVGTSGIGLGNTANFDVLSSLGGEVFGTSGIGLLLARLLILMVLSSAAASTQTTILPTARTTLSMATYRAIPKVFAKMHPRYLTPTVSTIVMGVLSALLYLWFNFTSGGFVISDAVTAIGLYIAFYYGLTGFACAWYYRKTLFRKQRDLWMQGILPVVGGLLMYGAGGWSIWADWDVASDNSYTSWLMPFWPHWYIGGVFVIAFLSALAGLVFGIIMRFVSPPFFKGGTLTRGTPTLVPDE
jgi:amino acid transporter